MFNIEARDLTPEDLTKARDDFGAIRSMRINVTICKENKYFIQQHVDNEGNTMGALTHQGHPDFLLSLRIMMWLLGNRLEDVAFPASSKLYPKNKYPDYEGELLEDGIRMFAFGEILGITYSEMIQHYQEQTMGVAKINLRALAELRQVLNYPNSYVGYFVEGGRGDGKGILRQAQDGIELLFANKSKNNREELINNKKTLGIPIAMLDTRFLKRNLDGYIRMFLSGFNVKIGQPFFAVDIVKDMEQFNLSFAEVIGCRLASLVPKSQWDSYYLQAKFQPLIQLSQKRNKLPYQGV